MEALFVDILSIHRVIAERCTRPIYCTYAMCEGILLWHTLKIIGFKVPTRYSLELMAKQPF